MYFQSVHFECVIEIIFIILHNYSERHVIGLCLNGGLKPRNILKTYNEYETDANKSSVRIVTIFLQVDSLLFAKALRLLTLFGFKKTSKYLCSSRLSTYTSTEVNEIMKSWF